MHGCIKIYLLSHTPTLIHLQTCWMVLQVDPGLTCSSVSGSCPGAGSHCTGAADSQAQHVNHWRKHRSTSALSLRRRFSRMLGAPNPGLDLGWSQYERFPLAPRGDVAGSSPKASIPSHRAPRPPRAPHLPGRQRARLLLPWLCRETFSKHTALASKRCRGHGHRSPPAQPDVPETTAGRSLPSPQPLAPAEPSPGLAPQQQSGSETSVKAFSQILHSSAHAGLTSRNSLLKFSKT